MNVNIFIKYNNADEKREAFRKALNKRKEWEEKMQTLIPNYATNLGL